MCGWFGSKSEKMLNNLTFFVTSGPFPLFILYIFKILSELLYVEVSYLPFCNGSINSVYGALTILVYYNFDYINYNIIFNK